MHNANPLMENNNVLSFMIPGSTSGLSIDYATNNGAEYAFIVELSGAAYGFESPTDDIEPTFRETWAGVVAMVDAIAAKQ